MECSEKSSCAPFAGRLFYPKIPLGETKCGDHSPLFASARRPTTYRRYTYTVMTAMTSRDEALESDEKKAGDTPSSAVANWQWRRWLYREAGTTSTPAPTRALPNAHRDTTGKCAWRSLYRIIASVHREIHIPSAINNKSGYEARMAVGKEKSQEVSPED